MTAHTALIVALAWLAVGALTGALAVWCWRRDHDWHCERSDWFAAAQPFALLLWPLALPGVLRDTWLLLTTGSRA